MLTNDVGSFEQPGPGSLLTTDEFIMSTHAVMHHFLWLIIILENTNKQMGRMTGKND